MKNSCKDCAAFAPLSHECRRHAPVMVPVPQVNPVTQQAQGFAAMGLYPATNAEQWCREFEPAVPALLQ